MKYGSAFPFRGWRVCSTSSGGLARAARLAGVAVAYLWGIPGARLVRARPGGAIIYLARMGRKPSLGADASWAEGAGVGSDLLECAGERFDVGVREVAREVLVDSVAVMAARLLHRLAALVREEDED